MQPIAARAELVQVGIELLAVVLRLRQQRQHLFPCLRANAGLPACLQVRAVGVDGRAQRDVLGAPTAEDAARVGLELFQHAVHRGTGQAGGEQGLADLSAPLQQGLGTLAQFVGTQPEQAAEEVLVDVAEKGGQRIVGQRLAVGIEQRVLVALAALKAQPTAVARGDAAGDAQVLIGVAKIVRGLAMDAVEQITDGAQQRALAGLVRTVDQMKIAAVDGQLQVECGKGTVGRDGKLLESHQARSSSS